MNKITRKLARKAGFVFWAESCPWAPPDQIVDWGSNYDAELQKHTELVVRETLKVLIKKDWTVSDLEKIALKHFDITDATEEVEEELEEAWNQAIK